MGERVLAGRRASPGRAAGPAWRLDPAPVADDGSAGLDPLAALDAVAAELDELAARLGGEEGEIVATGALMARDPALREAAKEQGLAAAIQAHAAALAALDDPMLAARADDVRSVGRRAQRILAGGVSAPPVGAVVVGDDAGPADVIELADAAGAFALAGGGETAHAAIVARSLGIPMVACLGEAILDAAGHVVVDGDAGIAVLSPDRSRLREARDAAERRRRSRERAAAERNLPAATLDGRRITVLANTASGPEVRVALDAGAEGAGLVRTELCFLQAPAWPTEAEHVRALTPILAPLAGRTATVRVLDFGGDKTPPFLRGERARGIALLLTAPDALAAQLRAILAAGSGTELRIMLPLVDGPEQVEHVRSVLPSAAVLGAMIETPAAAARAGAIAAVSDFLSIGTNDLTAATLGIDRFAAGNALPHDPRVLAHIDAAVRAADAARIPIEVCGEAASDPLMLPLLLGLRVGELSAGAARVGTVRAWVRALRADECHALAQAALRCDDVTQVAALAAPLTRRLELLERGDDGGELVQGSGGVIAVGPQA